MGFHLYEEIKVFSSYVLLSPPNWCGVAMTLIYKHTCGERRQHGPYNTQQCQVFVYHDSSFCASSTCHQTIALVQFLHALTP